MIERKCLKCITWNHDEKFCKSCGAPLAPEEIIKVEDAIREEKEKLKPKSKLDLLLERGKNSKYLPVRIAYYFFYSVGFIVFAIASFFVYLVAWSPG